MAALWLSTHQNQEIIKACFYYLFTQAATILVMIEQSIFINKTFTKKP